MPMQLRMWQHWYSLWLVAQHLNLWRLNSLTFTCITRNLGVKRFLVNTSLLEPRWLTVREYLWFSNTIEILFIKVKTNRFYWIFVCLTVAFILPLGDMCHYGNQKVLDPSVFEKPSSKRKPTCQTYYDCEVEGDRLVPLQRKCGQHWYFSPPKQKCVPCDLGDVTLCCQRKCQ